MKHGTFYLLPKNTVNIQKLNYTQQLICNLSYKQWKLGKKILITCDNKSQAIKVDEALWIFNHNTFLPHDLYKKNNVKIPIVIQWTQFYYDKQPRDLLINLMQEICTFFLNSMK